MNPCLFKSLCWKIGKISNSNKTEQTNGESMDLINNNECQKFTKNATDEDSPKELGCFVSEG